jgi:hypothetical protein
MAGAVEHQAALLLGGLGWYENAMNLASHADSVHRVALELCRGRQGRRIKAGRSLARWPVAHRQQPTFTTISASSGLMHCSRAALFDHLVGASKKRRWNGEAEQFCGLEVNRKLTFRRCLHR